MTYIGLSMHASKTSMHSSLPPWLELSRRSTPVTHACPTNIVASQWKQQVIPNSSWCLRVKQLPKLSWSLWNYYIGCIDLFVIFFLHTGGNIHPGYYARCMMYLQRSLPRSSPCICLYEYLVNCDFSRPRLAQAFLEKKGAWLYGGLYQWPGWSHHSSGLCPGLRGWHQMRLGVLTCFDSGVGSCKTVRAIKSSAFFFVWWLIFSECLQAIQCKGFTNLQH